MAQSKKTVKKWAWVAGLVFAALFSSARGASAASLYLSPASGSYLAGHTFTVRIAVSSVDLAMNAVQGSLSFPADKLSVISLSKASSIINLWVQDPSFSNKNGTVDFGGVVVNPGYQGTGGNILTITFQVKSGGVAPVTFVSGSVLANDGRGTNILADMQGATFSLTALAPPAAGASKIPPALIIASTPAMSDKQWYNINTVTFAWNMPTDIDGVNYAISNDPGFTLPKAVQTPTSSVTYDLSSLADGTWYFYASFESGGVWAPVAVRPFQIDRTPPEPFVIVQKTDTFGLLASLPAFQWAATDKTSGIASYQAKVGDGDWFDPASILKGNLYILPEQSPTNGRVLAVRAYDKAGNYRESSITFNIPGQACGGNGALCALQTLLTTWKWAVFAGALIVILLAYWFIYRIFLWKSRLRHELTGFREELRHDIKQLEDRVNLTAGEGRKVDLSPSHLAAKKEALREAEEHLEEDLKDELKKIDKL